MENKDLLSEEKKISLAKRAFAGFKAKIDELFKRQENLFKNIMDKIDKSDISGLRHRIDDLYEKENKQDKDNK